MKLFGKAQKSLKFKLLITIIFVAIYPIVLVILVGILNYENVVKERFFESAASEMELVSNYINKDVTDMDAFMVGLLSDQSMYALIRDHKDVDSALDQYNYQREVESYLRSAIASKLDFDVGALYLYDAARLYYASKRTGVISGEAIPYGAIEEQIEGLSLKTVYLNEDGLFLGRRILDKDTFKPIGLMVFRVDAAQLETIVGDRGSRTGSTNYLLTKEGQVVSHSGTGGHGGMIEGLELYALSSGNYEVKYKGVDYYVSSREVPYLNYTILRLTTKEELLNDLQKVTDLIVLLSIINLPLYIFLGNMLYKSITTPVNKLVEGMSKFEQGQLSVYIESDREDEFGYMIGTFNRMTETMKTLINEVYVEELARKDAEISALQEQINPHFLYNTLESINWRAQLAGQTDIATMIQSLSILMEASINRESEKEIDLAKEIYLTEQYLYLVRMRFGDKISYSKEVDPGVLDCRVPKLILQPIMENAIKHGIEPKGRGSVSLRVWEDLNRLHIEVKDTGVGMNHTRKTMLRRIFKQEEQPVATKERRRSIGMRNVARRLYLIYAEEVTLQVESKLEMGTTFTISLPIKKG